MKSHCLLGFLILGATACVPSPQITTSASTSPPCNFDQAVALLNASFENYGGARQFVTRTAIRTAVECIGPMAAEYELRRIAQRYGIKYGQIQRSGGGRMPAQATEEQKRQYMMYNDHAQGLKTVASTAKAFGYGTGALLASTGVAIPEAIVVYTGFTTAGTLINDLANTIETVNTYAYGKVLFSAPFNEQGIRQRILSEPSMNERKKILVEAINTTASSFPELEKLGPEERFQATDRKANLLSRYLLEVEDDLQKNKADADRLRADAERIDQARKQLANEVVTNNTSLVEKMDNLLKSVNSSRDESGSQFRFMLDLNDKKMTAQQRMIAIERFNYGGLSEDQKKKRLAQLKTQAEFETVQKEFGEGLTKLAIVTELIEKLGIKSPFLKKVVEFGQKVQTGVDMVTAVASQNYFGAIAKFSSLLGNSGGVDPAAAMHGQIMEALGQVVALQRKTIELQIETMNMISTLSQNIDIGLKTIDHRLDQILRLESFSWINSYYDRVLIPLAKCRDLKEGWRGSVLKAGRTQRQLEQLGLYQAIPGAKNGETAFSQIQEKEVPFEALPLSFWQSVPLNASEVQGCTDEMTRMKQSLFQAFGPTLATVPSEYTIEGVVIAAGGPDRVRKVMDEHRSSVQTLAYFLGALLEQDRDLYDRVIMAALMPSRNVRHLVLKMNYILHSENSAKILTAFREEQGGNLALYHALGERSTNRFLNPNTLAAFIGYWQDMANYGQLLKSGTLATPTNLLIHAADHEEKFERVMVRALNLTIVAQALMSGDGLLAAIDKYWKMPVYSLKDDRGNPIKQLDEDLAKMNIHQLAHKILLTNLQIRTNFVRYKLAKAYQQSPYLGYSLQVQLLDSLEDPQWFNIRHKASELTAELVAVGVRPLNHLAWLRLNPKQERLQNAPDSDTLLKWERDLDIMRVPAPSTEEFFEDQLITSSMIQRLEESKIMLMNERYHHDKFRQATRPESDRMRINEMAEEVKSASL